MQLDALLDALLAAVSKHGPGGEVAAHYRGRQVMLSTNGEVLATLDCSETPPADLAVGMAVLVIGLFDEAIPARVEEIRRRADSAAAEHWGENNITRMVVLSYRRELQEAAVGVLEIGGKWWDSRLKRLDIERIGPV